MLYDVKDVRIVKRSRVLIIGAHSQLVTANKNKQKFLGCTGTVLETEAGSLLPYILRIDGYNGNKPMWRPSEIMYLEDQSYVCKYEG